MPSHIYNLRGLFCNSDNYRSNFKGKTIQFTEEQIFRAKVHRNNNDTIFNRLSQLNCSYSG